MPFNYTLHDYISFFCYTLFEISDTSSYSEERTQKSNLLGTVNKHARQDRQRINPTA